MWLDDVRLWRPDNVLVMIVIVFSSINLETVNRRWNTTYQGTCLCGSSFDSNCDNKSDRGHQNLLWSSHLIPTHKASNLDLSRTRVPPKGPDLEVLLFIGNSIPNTSWRMSSFPDTQPSDAGSGTVRAPKLVNRLHKSRSPYVSVAIMIILQPVTRWKCLGRRI